MNQLACRRALVSISTAFFFAALATVAAAQKPSKESLHSGGVARTYYLLAPDQASPGPAPLVVLLHGSGHDGMSLVDRWERLARAEGIILAAPDALDRSGWQIPGDGPDFVHEVVEAVRERHAVDPHRIYLFGHSAGAGQALSLALLESQYFAAAAVHAGALTGNDFAYLDVAKRKTPIAMWIGTKDALVPLQVVRETRAALDKRGFAPVLTEMPGHTHDYYGSADQINRDAWAFLQAHPLEGEPQYQRYGPVR